jgi:probable HAF family extracellular repeat protein
MTSRRAWTLPLCLILALALTQVVARTAFAQTYSLAQIGTLGSTPAAVNEAGQVTGSAVFAGGTHGFFYSNGMLTDLGTLGGSTSQGTAINASGQIAGYSLTASGDTHAFLYSNGSMTDLGTLGGTSSQATALNTGGQIVGYSTTTGGDTHAFLYSAGSMTDLGTLGGSSSQATAINDSGQITGSSSTAASIVLHPFLYSAGSITDLGPGPSNLASGSGTAINAAGQVTGYIGNSNHGTDAFLYGSGTLTRLTNGTTFDSTGQAINSSGQVAVYYNDLFSAQHAYLYTNGSLQFLGSLPVKAGIPVNTTSDPHALNDAGWVTGQAGAADLTYPEHAFLYTIGPMLDLNDLIDGGNPLKQSVTLTGGNAITNSGYVVAQGTNTKTGFVSAYLLQLEVETLTVAPSFLTFASTPTGTATPTQPVTVKNIGAATFGFDPMQLTGDYTQTNNCAPTLAPGATCMIQVAFAPTQPGARTGVLTIASGGTSYSVNLSGFGTLAATITASPTSVTVGVPTMLQWSAPSSATCTATGGNATDGWTGSIQPTGTQNVTESAAGSYMYGVSCVGGGQSAQAQVTVAMTQLTVSVSATPTTQTAAQPITVSWTSSSATSCTASGGGSGDAWPGAKPTSGSATVTEATFGTFTYTVTCVSGPISAVSSATVHYVSAPSSGGGSGAMDGWSLLPLLVIVGLRLLTPAALAKPMTTIEPTGPFIKRDWVGTRAGLAWGLDMGILAEPLRADRYGT